MRHHKILSGVLNSLFLIVLAIMLASCANRSADAIQHGMEQRQSQPVDTGIIDSNNDRDFRG